MALDGTQKKKKMFGEARYPSFRAKTVSSIYQDKREQDRM